MIPLANLKSALRVTHTADDALITELEERAVAYVERATGRTFSTGTSVEYVPGGNGPNLWLSNPVDTVTTVVARAYADGTETAIAEADAEGFEVRGSRLFRTGGGVWSSDNEHIVTYERLAAPDDIVQAVEQLVQQWYNVRLPVALGTTAPDMPNAVSDIIGLHKDWGF